MSDDTLELAVRILITCVSVTWLVILWRADQSAAMPNFGFRNLISTKEGYPDRVAIMELGAWLAMSAVIVIAVLRSATELATLCGIYVGAFTLRGAAASVTHAMSPPTPAVPGVVTTTDTTVHSKETKKGKA